MSDDWMWDERLQAIRERMRDPESRLHIAGMNLRVARGDAEDGLPARPELGDACLEEIAQCHRELAALNDELVAMRRAVRAG